MSYRLHHWQTFSTNEEWCCSGYSILDLTQLQKSVNDIGRRLMDEKGAVSVPDLKVFIMPRLTKLEPNA